MRMDNERHGLSGMPFYCCWRAMHRRCHDPKDHAFRWYGGRGITVCSRWNSVHAFLEDMGHPPSGMSIGRIDNDGPYEPQNCRWETSEQQAENTTRNRYVTWQGETQTIKGWARRQNIAPQRVSERLRRGWTVDRALTTPCPCGFEEGRRRSVENARAFWARHGARYRAASKERRQAAKH